jgi:hypothetical protein
MRADVSKYGCRRPRELGVTINENNNVIIAPFPDARKISSSRRGDQHRI